MNNLQKRILTSLILFPLSIFFIIKGGNYIVSFLYAVLILGNFELFSAFKRKLSIIFLDGMLVLSLLSILYLRNDTTSSFVLLIWVIILTVSSDVGGYIVGKIFKWKKLTKISPKKTLSGVFGSFIFSLLSIFIANATLPWLSYTFLSSKFSINLLDPKFFFLAIILSLVAQAGDLTISYFKRIEKIKDTGRILPGHGGIFDRIDALMFVVILTFVLYQIKIIP